MRKEEEILFWKKARTILKKGYGANCKTYDLDDFRKEYCNKKNKVKDSVISDSRCGSCRAEEAIVFIDKHIDLLKM